MRHAELYALSLWTTLALLSGCQLWPSKWVNTRHQALFELSLPAYLSPTEELAPDAPFQYESRREDLFLVIRYSSLDSLYEAKPSYSTEDYYDFHITNLLAPMREPEASSADSIEINGLVGLQGDFSGYFKQDRLYFRLCLLEGDSRLFQILIWTTEAKKDQHAPEMERILGSFALLRNPVSETQSDSTSLTSSKIR
ncbi:MAG: hypothetical protein AAF804_17375 [Bacteroidota bacterium]